MYVKIYEQIFNSSIMEEDVETRYVWFCLLTLADRDGFVDMTTSSIARRINIDEDKVIKAIDKFIKPDLSSRTKGDEGRRLEKIRESFGWKITNYTHYRDLKTDEMRREYMKDYMRTHREGEEKTDIAKTKKKKEFVPPTLEEVRLYVSKNNYHVKPEDFFNYFTTGKWTDSKGNKVRNWKQKLITWEQYKKKERGNNGYAGRVKQPLACEEGTVENKYENLQAETIINNDT